MKMQLTFNAKATGKLVLTADFSDIDGAALLAHFQALHKRDDDGRELTVAESVEAWWNEKVLHLMHGAEQQRRFADEVAAVRAERKLQRQTKRLAEPAIEEI